jgi:hypothetical protein
VTDEQTTDDETTNPQSHSESKRDRWHRRPSVCALRREAKEHEDREFTRKWDDRDNDGTRLPAGETIHLGGFVFTEAFTPSTVSALYKALEDWPDDRKGRKQEWLNQLTRSRSGDGMAWQDLGLVRPPGKALLGHGYHDADLPAGVDAVWLSVSYVTQTLAMVVATFTLSEDAGDLSKILRRDYRTRHVDVDVRVHGRLGALRARIPWSRPASHGVSYRRSSAEEQKREACSAVIRDYEDKCGRWFFKKFPGRFSAATPQRRPVIRMLFTKEHVPYLERHPWLRPVGLDLAFPLWRSNDPEGWWLSENFRSNSDRLYVLTLAARRADAAKEPAKGTSGESNWYLTQQFGSDQAPFAARYAMLALLSLYSDRLSDLRDKAGIRRFPRHPVSEARRLDDYLIGDGLDAATVTADLELLTQDLTGFGWDVWDFTEEREHLPPTPDREPSQYVPSLCAAVQEQAGRLANDATTTTGNIKASAELRQAMANTRLQRIVVSLSVIAIVIAVVSLLTASHS